MPATTFTVPTPTGPFTVLRDADGAVLASGWTDSVDALVGLPHPTLRPDSVVPGEPGAVGAAVRAYLAGEVGAIDAVPVRQRSGEFLTYAWDVLRGVPAGVPLTYTAYAARAGRPDAVRAAANACGRNAAALFVPCHRILRTDGSLGGFRWGLPVKRWLLAHEASAAGTGV
ncbi:methylated-DNA--[protein]-cysteine S-methyltransferase [Actinocatenispora rupis]|uniref:Putative methylated-DNA:protein-cysteine methyltransferase n=1 Tax=Actinocatenispora rupis TaxID=519421 RepID=A0A8J3NBA7_9ACTN|nr:methylated-DNA--[protein]-cysteine S-methyltransferase [Actinocatenispora rupis]GID10462.1 putative methylated-DNA:protein-cysteine methyltransferase [Actinocatenispora rupis]